MTQDSESLERRLYDSFYENFAMDGKENHAKEAKFMSKCGKWLRNSTIIATLGIGVGLVRKYSKNKKINRRDFVKDLAIISVPAFFAKHFHDFSKIFDAMYKKGNGKELTNKEIEEVKESGKNGRYAHIAGFSVLGAGIAGEVLTRRGFLSKTALFTSVGLYAIIVKDGYGGLYDSAVDYTIGERK